MPECSLFSLGRPNIKTGYFFEMSLKCNVISDLRGAKRIARVHVVSVLCTLMCARCMYILSLASINIWIFISLSLFLSVSRSLSTVRFHCFFPILLHSQTLARSLSLVFVSFSSFLPFTLSFQISFFNMTRPYDLLSSRVLSIPLTVASSFPDSTDTCVTFKNRSFYTESAGFTYVHTYVPKYFKQQDWTAPFIALNA